MAVIDHHGIILDITFVLSVDYYSHHHGIACSSLSNSASLQVYHFQQDRSFLNGSSQHHGC